MFIVIEGIDGSGKWTQLHELKTTLEGEGKRVLTLDFPRYECESSYFVKKYLNGAYGDHVPPKVSSLFYALDRYEALLDFEKTKQDFDIILSNRYVYSSMIHQWAKFPSDKQRVAFFEWVDELEFTTLWLPRPDLVFFLDVPPSISDTLVSKKEKRDYIESDENKDLHEKDIDHMKNAYLSAKQLTSLYDNWLDVPCIDESGKMKSINEITHILLDHVKI